MAMTRIKGASQPVTIRGIRGGYESVILNFSMGMGIYVLTRDFEVQDGYGFWVKPPCPALCIECITSFFSDAMPPDSY